MNPRKDPNASAAQANRELSIVEECRRLSTCDGDYSLLEDAQISRRIRWWEERGSALHLEGSLPRQAYTLFLLRYLGLSEEDVPVVFEDERRIVWRSYNFCPTLEACIRLGLDTRTVCRESKARSVQVLIARLDPRLRFSRDYGNSIRPYGPYCEEWIELVE